MNATRLSPRRRGSRALFSVGLAALTLSCAALTPAFAQSVALDASPAARAQTIDGFGTALAGVQAQDAWWQQLYFEDLRASIVRTDLVPRFKAPYSDFTYNSPWFHNSPPLPGPDNNNVRTYTSVADYSRSFGGRNAPIAVMGPDIDQNIQVFNFNDDKPRIGGLVAAAGAARAADLGDFKFVGSMWSPAPWLKISSGNTISGQSGVFPVNGTPWPFVWNGNFSGGRLDTSDTPLPQFDDSSLGGTGPTSALTQFARCLAAYLRGYQNAHGVQFHAISIQNELNFETFYDSCTYPLSSQYIAALKAARAELDKYPDLAGIQIMGPEDLLGGDPYSLYQFGGGATTVHKNLQYLENIAADPAAAAALSFFCIHGYAPDGVTAGGTPTQWDRWVNGWSASPAPGIPANVPGFAAYGKKSWMTETSGENPNWLHPTSGFPGEGAFGVALRIQQALTAGRESAWIYWQMTDGSDVAASTLTDANLRQNSPKYVAAKHFFRYIRPGAQRIAATVSGSSSIQASAFVHDADNTLAVVLINTAPSATTVSLQLPAAPAVTSLLARTSSNGALWQNSTFTPAGGSVAVAVPAYGVVTLYSGAEFPGGPPVETALTLGDFDAGSSTFNAWSPNSGSTFATNDFFGDGPDGELRVTAPGGFTVAMRISVPRSGAIMDGLRNNRFISWQFRTKRCDQPTANTFINNALVLQSDALGLGFQTLTNSSRFVGSSTTDAAGAFSYEYAVRDARVLATLEAFRNGAGTFMNLYVVQQSSGTSVVNYDNFRLTPTEQSSAPSGNYTCLPPGGGGTSAGSTTSGSSTGASTGSGLVFSDFDPSNVWAANDGATVAVGEHFRDGSDNELRAQAGGGFRTPLRAFVARDSALLTGLRNNDVISWQYKVRSCDQTFGSTFLTKFLVLQTDAIPGLSFAVLTNSARGVSLTDAAGVYSYNFTASDARVRTAANAYATGAGTFMNLFVVQQSDNGSVVVYDSFRLDPAAASAQPNPGGDFLCAEPPVVFANFDPSNPWTPASGATAVVGEFFSDGADQELKVTAPGGFVSALQAPVSRPSSLLDALIAHKRLSWQFKVRSCEKPVGTTFLNTFVVLQTDAVAGLGFAVLTNSFFSVGVEDRNGVYSFDYVANDARVLPALQAFKNGAGSYLNLFVIQQSDSGSVVSYDNFTLSTTSVVDPPTGDFACPATRKVIADFDPTNIWGANDGATLSLGDAFRDGADNELTVQSPGGFRSALLAFVDRNGSLLTDLLAFNSLTAQVKVRRCEQPPSNTFLNLFFVLQTDALPGLGFAVLTNSVGNIFIDDIDTVYRYNYRTEDARFIAALQAYRSGAGSYMNLFLVQNSGSGAVVHYDDFTVSLDGSADVPGGDFACPGGGDTSGGDTTGGDTTGGDTSGGDTSGGDTTGGDTTGGDTTGGDTTGGDTTGGDTTGGSTTGGGSAIADFTGDGNADIAIQRAKRVRALVGPDFAEAIDLLEFDSILKVVVGARDFNADGSVDLIVQRIKDVSVLFGPGYTNSASIGQLPSLAYRVAAAGDVNGDGSVDIVLEKGRKVFFVLQDPATGEFEVDSIELSLPNARIGVAGLISTGLGVELLLQEGRDLTSRTGTGFGQPGSIDTTLRLLERVVATTPLTNGAPHDIFVERWNSLRTLSGSVEADVPSLYHVVGPQ